MSEKKHIELHVSSSFLERKMDVGVNSDELKFGDPHKNEPDILYKDMGIEIGAVLKGTNTHIDHYEEKFLLAASEKIKGKIHSNFQIRLVMQDDTNTVEHTPTQTFKDYKVLPKYLDGIFIYQYDKSTDHQKIVLNQRTRMRALTFPGNTTGKEFVGFVEELISFVLSLAESDFQEQNGNKFHHSVVTNGEVVGHQNPLDDFVSPKIVDKLSKDKYSGAYSKQILLLHNYSIAGNTQFTSDIHFYTHHRNDIFNLIFDLISDNDSFRFYSGIYFLDFSVYAFNSNLNLIDFLEYTHEEPSKFLHGYDEIRVDGGIVLNKPKS